MAVINTPVSAAATNTEIDANQTVTNTVGRHVVHVTLIFEDVDFVPDDIYDALDTEYGTVAYAKNTCGDRGTYIFNISA